MEIPEGQLYYIKNQLIKIATGLYGISTIGSKAIDLFPADKLSELEKIGLKSLKDEMNKVTSNHSDMIHEVISFIKSLEEEAAKKKKE